MITEQTSLSDLLNTAIAAVQDLVPGETFIVKDLFRGFEWARISRGYRIKLGSMFFFYTETEGSQFLKALGKTPQSQQIYQKK